MAGILSIFGLGRVSGMAVNEELKSMEAAFYEKLSARFGAGDLEFGYRSESFPEGCSVYVSSRDLYIDLNHDWVHGDHWYGREGDDRQAVLWRYRMGNPVYAAAAAVWSVRDVKKRDDARRSGLNYITFWDPDFGDADVWFASGCPDGQDWLKEYSWLPDRALTFTKTGRRSLAGIVHEYQADVFYHRELELWRADGPYGGFPSIRMFLYANRLQYKGKGPDSLTDQEILSGFGISGILRSHTVFDTAAMAEAVGKYHIDSVYDPCAGWGERMLFCHKNGIRYCGMDVNDALADGYARMSSDFGMKDQVFQVGDSSVSMPPCGRMKAVLTCPPYGNTEIYSEKGAENLDGAGFLDWWEAVVGKSMAVDPEYFCFQVNRAYRDAMLERVVSAGFVLVDEIFCKVRSSHWTRGKGGQNRKSERESMLVLKKI